VVVCVGDTGRLPLVGSVPLMPLMVTLVAPSVAHDRSTIHPS
jgi:hypothetical protein